MYERKIKFKKILFSKHVGELTLINALLAIVAFLKDMVFAAYYGTSSTADLFTIAFFLPDTIGNNVVGSALVVACVPIFSTLAASGHSFRLENLIRKILLQSVVVSATISFIIILFRHRIYHWLGSEIPASSAAMLQSFVLLLLPTLTIFSLVAIFTAILQAKEEFYAPACAPVLFNGIFLIVVLVLVIVKISRETGGIVTAAGVLVAALAMLFLLLYRIYFYDRRKRNGLLLQRVNGRQKRIDGAECNQMEGNRQKEISMRSRNDINSIYQVFVPYVLILLSMQAVYGVERHIAATMPAGTIAALQYAFRISQFPNWVFVSAITTILLPKLAKAQVARDEKEFRNIFYKGIRELAVIAVPISLGIFLFRKPILELLFEHGAFNDSSLLATSAVLKGYSLSILGQSISALLLRFFIAIRQMMIPTGIFIFTSCINIYFDFHWKSYFKTATFGYGAATASFINVICMWMYFMYLEKKNQSILHGQVSG
ncbi:oligosaccharide flippase family protein [Fodinisporobacter ferrooxydans]|uniref:Oligosaccharide flippase family protein n=1 Tax=Fodinisporobacter ferrooxydans TaxID=2901836 RepID=A0ABY4CEU6_9BACL|nr:oligosaccharide flippase family protein [Alicyclobacillaceae bacterium MYW30-H2]